MSLLLPTPFSFTTPLTVTTMTATIAAGFVLARIAGSRARAAQRDRLREFEQSLEEFLAGHTRGRELLRRAARLTPDDFWETISLLRAGTKRRALRDVEQALERSRHVIAERRELAHGAPARRELAARRLGDLGAARYRKALRRALMAGPEALTLAAGVALARIRDDEALIWLLENPASLSHRPPSASIGLLTRFGRRAAPRLHAALAGGVSDARMERAIVEALARFGHRDSIDRIAPRLGHEWRDVRVAAARALGRLGASQHSGALIAALQDEDWRVRAQAARSLGRLAAREAIPGLYRAISDTSWWVRRHSAYALASLGDDGRRVLNEAAQSHADRYARDIAAEALAGGFPPRAWNRAPFERPA